MLRLAGASEIVVLAREKDNLSGDAEMFKRPEPLLTLFDRHAIVVV